MTARIIHGDCLDVMRRLAGEGVLVDSVVTDPPYELGFMGRAWDRSGIANQVETWKLVASVMKPGAHLVAFGGSRTFHRVACAIEDAGLEIRDTIMWLYGSGFSKVGMLKNRHPELWCKCDGEQATEHDLRSVQRADLSAGEHSLDQCGEVLFPSLSQSGTQEHWSARTEPETGDGEQPGLEGRSIRRAGQGVCDGAGSRASESEGQRLCVRTHSGGRGDAGQAVGAGRGSASHQPGSGRQPAGESEGLRQPHRALDGGALRDGGRCPRCGGISRAFDGFGGSLKPSFEPIILARKPLIGTVAANVLKHGTGALNIDGCRIPANGEPLNGGKTNPGYVGCRDGWRRPFQDDPAYMADRARIEADKVAVAEAAGRWPANLCHDGSPEVLEAFARFKTHGAGHARDAIVASDYDASSYDTGTAARFFYSSKASARDRITRDVEEVTVEWISEQGPCRVRLQADTGQLPQRAIVASGSGDSSEWSTFLSGSNITALCRMASRSTIETQTSLTTASTTWNSLIRSLTSGCTVDVSCETASGGNHAGSAAPFILSATITLGETASLPGASHALSGTQLKISVSAKRHGHPTTKPVSLMRWLCRLVTPPGGLILDPFSGSGTTLQAAAEEGFRAIGIEREAEYVADIERRLAKAADLFTEAAA